MGHHLWFINEHDLSIVHLTIQSGDEVGQVKMKYWRTQQNLSAGSEPNVGHYGLGQRFDLPIFFSGLPQISG